MRRVTASRAGRIGWLMTVGACIASCAKQSAPDSTAVKAQEATPTTTAAERKSPSERSLETKTSPAEAALAVRRGPVPAENPPSEVPAEQTPAPVERVILFTASGPLLVHLEIYVQGQPQRLAVDRVLAEVMQLASDNSQTGARWARLVADPRFERGEFGNAAPSGSLKPQQIVQQFDFNHDGRIQREELIACLARDSAGGRTFSVQSTRDTQPAGRQDVSLFALLDEDRDGRLSPAEIAAAPQRLRSRDDNDNDVLIYSELRGPLAAEPAMAPGGNPGRQLAIEVQKWTVDSIYYRLCEMVGVNNTLPASAFAINKGLFCQLDLDSSGAIDPPEIAGLSAARPDLKLKIDFAPPPGAERPGLQVLKLSDDLASAGATATVEHGRLELQWAGAQVAFLLDDLPGKMDANAAATESATAPDRPEVYSALQVQVRVGSVEDALFNWLDVKPEGRLTSREMAGAPERLAQLDSDGDGFVSAAELRDRLTCVIQRGARGQSPGEYPGVVRDIPRDSDSPRWLTAMDQNLDGEISRREFLGTAEQFTRLDLNGDGFLEADEVRQQLESALEASSIPSQPAAWQPVANP